MKRKAQPASLAATSFRRALVSALPAALPYFISILLLFTLSTFIDILGYDSRIAQNAQQYISAGEPVPTLQSLYRYILFNTEMGFLPLQLFAILMPVLLGFVLFRFMANKRTVNVFYSLGLTRRSLFMTRYLAGQLLLLLASLLPVAANLILNLAFFGSCRELWISAAAILAALIVMSSLSFAVTAAVFSCVGTVSEGVVYSVLSLFSPSILLAGADGLMSRVWGSPFGTTFETMDFGRRIYSLLLNFQQVQPVFLLKASCGQVCQLPMNEKWTAPNGSLLLLWALLTVGIVALGAFLFQRRKAEICGFLGKNRVLNVLGVVSAGFLCFGAVFKVSAPLPDFVAVILGILAYAAVYCVFYLALTRDGKRFRKKLRFLPVHLSAAALLGVLVVTGFCGFSSYVPAISEVQSADVVMPNQSIKLSGYSGTRGIDNQVFSEQGGLVPGFSSERDLQLITRLHRQLAEVGRRELKKEGSLKDRTVRTGIQFVYTLKDGRQVRRHYERIPISLLTQFLQLEDSDRYHALIREVLTTEPEPEAYDRLNYMKEQVQAINTVLLDSKWLAKEREIPLSELQRRELLRCISDDLCAQPAQERYHPSAPALGAIAFIHRDGESEREGSFSREISGTPASLRIVITRDMTNTLAFIQEHAGADFVEEDPPIRRLSVIHAKWNDNPEMETIGSFPYTFTWYAALEFSGGWGSVGFPSDNAFVGSGPTLDAFQFSCAIRDPAQIKEIMSHAYLNYFLDTDGYYVLAEFEEGNGYSIFFLPESEAPESIRNAVN